MTDSEKTIKVYTTDAKNQVRVSLRPYNGNTYLNFRNFFIGRDGSTWFPSKEKGFNMKLTPEALAEIESQTPATPEDIGF